MDQVVTVWTRCEATVEERWVLRAPSQLPIYSANSSIFDLLGADAVEVLAVENLAVHSEHERRVIRVEVAGLEALPDSAVEADVAGRRTSGDY